MGVERLPWIEEKSHFVYAMLCAEDGKDELYIKFGYSSSIGERLTSLRTSCPIPAKYFAIIETPTKRIQLKLEKALHKRFDARRITGEWFLFKNTPNDKREFNDGCAMEFSAHLGGGVSWTKVPVAQLDRHYKERRKVFMKRKDRKKVEARRAAKKRRAAAWDELSNYGK